MFLLIILKNCDCLKNRKSNSKCHILYILSVNKKPVYVSKSDRKDTDQDSLGKEIRQDCPRAATKLAVTTRLVRVRETKALTCNCNMRQLLSARFLTRLEVRRLYSRKLLST